MFYDFNKKGKPFLLSLMLIFSIILMSACGSATQPGSNEKEASSESQNPDQNLDEIIVIRTAHGQPTTNIRHQLLEEFGRILSERTNGKVKLEIYPSGQLYGDKDIIEATIRGDIELGVPLAGNVESIDRRFALIGAPFVFESSEDVFDFIQTDRSDKFTADVFEKRGLKYLGYTSHGTSFIITSSKSRLDSPESIKGQKIRTVSGPVWQEPIKLLGGSPVTIDGAELTTALMTGVVDGVYTSVLAAKSFKLYELGQKYALAGDWGASFGVALFNAKFWESLSQDIQSAILESWKDLEKYNQEIVQKEESSVISELQENGMTIDLLNESNPYYDKFVEVWGQVRDNIVKELPEDLVSIVMGGKE